MSNNAIATLLWLGVLAFAVSANQLVAEGYPDATTLKGLKGVAVQVFADPPLSKVALRTRLELKLRQSGIKMPAGDDRRSGLGKPVLELDAYVRCGQSQICACHVNLRLWQDAQLSRDPRIAARAITWQNSYTRTVGYTGTAIRPDLTTDSTDLMVDIDTLTLEFIQDYLTVNPK